jgi:hypothetical protein
MLTRAYWLLEHVNGLVEDGQDVTFIHRLTAELSRK